MEELRVIRNKILNLDYNNPEEVEEIRNMVKNFSSDIGAPSNNLDQAIQKAGSSYKKKTPGRILEIVKENNELSKFVSIFVGDQAMGNWIYFNPEQLSDAEARALLVSLAKFTPPHEELRNFIKIFFQDRKREVWMEAAKALAILAIRDTELKDYIKDLWQLRFPNGIEKKWFTEKAVHGGDKIADPKKIIIHEARHILYAVSCYYSLTKEVADFPGYDLKTIENIGFPKDESASSVVISSLAMIWSVEEFRNIILNILQNHLAKVVKTLLNEDALREFYQHKKKQTYSDDEKKLFNLLDNYLLNVSFVNNAYKYDETIEIIFSWTKSIRLLSKFNENVLTEHLDTIHSELKEISSIILDDKSVINGKRNYLEQIVNKLADIFNENIWGINSIFENSLNIVCALLLSDKKEISDLPIKHIIGLTKTQNNNVLSYRYEGTLSQKIYPLLLDLLITFSGENEKAPRFFFSEKNYERNLVFKLSSIENGYISTQVAIQLEHHLRTQKSSLEKIRLLWQLLVYNPQSKVFLELQKVIRGDDTPLHNLVSILYELDKMRDNATESVVSYINGYNRLASSVKMVLGQSKDVKGQNNQQNLEQEASELISMLDNLSNEFQSLELSGPDITMQLTMAVNNLKNWLGTGEQSLLIKWFTFLELDLGNLEAFWRAFIESYKDVVSLLPHINEKQIIRMEQCLFKLETELQKITWPELKILSSFSAVIRNWIKELYEVREKSHQLNTGLMDIAENKKDINLLTSKITELLQNEENLNLILPATIKSAHQFLQSNLEIRVSEKLRKNKIISDKVKLNSFIKFISPLMIGVMAGPFIVLDIGSIWAELVSEGKQLYYTLTVVTALFISSIMFYLNFFSTAVSHSDVKFKLSYRIKLFSKGSMVFASSFTIAFVTSSTVLLTLSDTSLSAELKTISGFLKLSLLWSSLSLLFGWFIGIILQGRKILND